MELEKFSEIINKKIKYLSININNIQINRLYIFMNLLIEWNKKYNLTAILEPEEIITKHFIDSLTICDLIKKNSNIIDIGTGAGFPGIPVKIINEQLDITLLDSLNKRINFLENVIDELKLQNTIAIHSRAEDLGKDNKYREQFDYVTSRAVAPLNYLVEYMLPFVKIGGKCICMKGVNIEDELKQSERAVLQLGGKISIIKKIQLPETDFERNIIIIEKIKSTPAKYPRKAGMPKKQPIM